MSGTQPCGVSPAGPHLRLLSLRQTMSSQGSCAELLAPTLRSTAVWFCFAIRAGGFPLKLRFVRDLSRRGDLSGFLVEAKLQRRD
jgi:hypothetical protein